jgi:hypothetical protein
MDWLPKQDLLSILITFSMGFVAGVYLYVVGFGDLVTRLTIANQEAASEFVIVADMYGSCEPDCPSFQVQSDGSYRYLYVPRVGVEEVLREGVLPLNIRREIRNAVSVATLERQSQETEPADCNSFGDGVDVIYDITVDGEQYTIDSCGTTVDGDSALWRSLNSIWEYFNRL